MTIFKQLAIILTFLLSFSITTTAGEMTWCRTDTTKANYMIDGKTVRQVIFSVSNTSDENIWLLFENDDTKTTHYLIRERYLRKQDGETSLFDMITDPNAIFGDWIYDISTCFLKVIKPHSVFYVIVTYQDEVAAYNMIDRIRLISMQDLIKAGSFLTIIDSENFTTYHPDCLSINI